ncbi:MAG TPA: type I-U CRISPR-associated helicase/endonuclease Cas3, partial [Candidatus Accumulibacter sp.]|nr:type I-U CRISPR-associated helicase/endonuclease Cas3 [Accumulibacter sp.]
MMCERSRDAAPPMLAWEIRPDFVRQQTTLTDAMAQDAQSFPSWYEQRHGYLPFPWQAALAGRVAAEDWPEALTPPTGSGKTAVIDVWLWARLQGLRVPRRLVYVIDRRLVVDGVTEYAKALAAGLEADQQPTVVSMRGGMTIEEDWLSDPLRLAVIISTVDQVCSRLLFSGYGISPQAASIHAGLLGNDALFVVDEVHLVRPLLQTLASVAAQRGNVLPLPWRVLPMSATWAGANTHGLSDADWAHPVLSRRIKVGKPALLIKLAADADRARTLTDEALRLRQEGAGVVAVVCNRVDRARGVRAPAKPWRSGTPHRPHPSLRQGSADRRVPPEDGRRQPGPPHAALRRGDADHRGGSGPGHGRPGDRMRAAVRPAPALRPSQPPGRTGERARGDRLPDAGE